MGLDMKKVRALAAKKAEESSEQGDFPPWLDLDVDEEFVGKIVTVRKNKWDDTGKTHIYEVHQLDDEDEVFSLRAHKALVSKIGKQEGKAGDTIYIKALGKVKSQESKFKYNDYEVAVMTPEEVEDMSTSGKRPARREEEEEPEEKPAKKLGKKPAPKEKEEEPDEEPAKKPAKKSGAYPEFDRDEMKTFIKKALEFNDGEIALAELIRLGKSRGIKFADETDARKKVSLVGYYINDDDMVTKSE